MDDLNLMANKYPKRITVQTEETKSHKWRLSIIIAIIAVVMFSKYFFNFTNNLLGDKVHIADDGVPTTQGLILHGILFFIIVRIVLW